MYPAPFRLRVVICLLSFVAAHLGAAVVAADASATPRLEVPPFAEDLDLRTVEDLFKSAVYRVEVRRAGTANYARSFVFETRNTWTVRDFRGPDPARVVLGAEEFGGFKGEIRTASFAQFSFAHTAVEVRVTLLTPGAAARSVTVRPLRHAIPVVIAADGRSFTFTLPRPLKISVEVNDRLNPLFLFADAPDVPEVGATHYFGPGLHRLPGDGRLTLNSGEHVYLAAGAIVEGRFLLAPESSDIQIRGRGILSTGEWPHASIGVGYLVENATFYSGGTHHLLIEGLTLVLGTGWTVAIEDFTGKSSHDNRYENLKMVHWAGNTDGIWITGDRNRVDDCFMFINDDAIVSKGGDGGRVSNLVFWGGVWGHLTLWFNFGRSITDLTYEHIDVIGKEGGRELIWERKARAAGPIDLRDITFRDVRIEERRQPAGPESPNRFIRLQGEGRVAGLRFEDVEVAEHLADEGSIPIIDPQAPEGVVFKNLRMGGRPIRSAEESHLTFGTRAANVKFLPAPAP